MDKKTEALKLALGYMDGTLMTEHLTGYERKRHVMQSIREALAEQCVCGEPDTLGTHRTDGPCLAEQPAQQQEPVAWMDADGDLYKDEPKENWCPPHTTLHIPTAKQAVGGAG